MVENTLIRITLLTTESTELEITHAADDYVH